MSILCLLFGHQPPVYSKPGWYSPGNEYAQIKRGVYEDGIGRLHAEVFSECPRCGKEFRLCRIHVPRVGEQGSSS